MSKETAARRLARWVTELSFNDLSPEVLFHAKRCILDTLGVQLRGATLPWVQPVYEYVRSVSGTGLATVSYHGDRLATPYAAYANSTFSCSCELQHHGVPESAHPGVTVIPAVQAVGEQLGSTGQEIITAIVAGYEVQGRLAEELFKPEFAHFFDPKQRHFHPEGLFGVFSATAAAGRLLKLDEVQLAHAFAIAGSHASGILEYDQSGGEVKRIHSAIAARSGIQSAFLAKAGLTGPKTVFEGRHGIFAAFGGRPADSDQLFNGMARPIGITRCRFRVYPTIGTCHTALDIINDLLKSDPFDFREVRTIKVGMRERAVMHVTAITRPVDVISAQASLGFSIGMRLVKGSNNLDMYIDPALWSDPDIISVAEKLQAYTLVNENYPRFNRVEITLKSGRIIEGEQLYPRGSEKLPFSQEILLDKFDSLAGAVLPNEKVKKITEAVENFETLPSLSALVPLMTR